MVCTKHFLCIFIFGIVTSIPAYLDVWVTTETDINAYIDSVDALRKICDSWGSGAYACAGSWTDPGDTSITCVGDSDGICNRWASLHYRYNGMIGIRDGHLPSYRTVASNVNYPKGSRPFQEGPTFPRQPYLAYGRTERFRVPRTGYYSFFVHHRELGFLFMDGKIINNASSGIDNILANWHGEVLGTVDFSDPVLAESRSEYKTDHVFLEHGIHTFELYYTCYHAEEGGEFIIKWRTPDMTGDQWEIIPPRAFGGAQQGEHQAKITGITRNEADIGTDQTVAIQDSVAFTFRGELVEPAESTDSLTYIWDMGDGTIVETDTNSLTHVFREKSFPDFPFRPVLTIRYNGYESKHDQSPVAFRVADISVGTSASIPARPNSPNFRKLGNTLVFDNKYDIPVRFSVYALNGKHITDRTVRPHSRTKLQFPGLSPGLYLVHMHTGDGRTEIGRFINR